MCVCVCLCLCVCVCVSVVESSTVSSSLGKIRTTHNCRSESVKGRNRLLVPSFSPPYLHVCMYIALKDFVNKTRHYLCSDYSSQQEQHRHRWQKKTYSNTHRIHGIDREIKVSLFFYFLLFFFSFLPFLFMTLISREKKRSATAT